MDVPMGNMLHFSVVYACVWFVQKCIHGVRILDALQMIALRLGMAGPN